MTAEDAIVPSTAPAAIVEIVAPLDFYKLKEALEKFQRFKRELLTDNDRSWCG